MVLAGQEPSSESPREAALQFRRDSLVARGACTSARVTTVQADRARPSGRVTRGWRFREESEAREEEQWPHFTQKPTTFFYCVVFTLDSNMLVQSIAGKTSMDPLTGFPSPPCTLLLLIPLCDPSAEAVIKEHFGCKQWAAYNTRMGWEWCPPRTWNPHKWLERQDASSVANRMMEFKTHNWFLFSFWIPGVYRNQLFLPLFYMHHHKSDLISTMFVAYIFEWCALKLFILI